MKGSHVLNGVQDAAVVCIELAGQGIAIGPYGLPQKLGIVQRNPDAVLRPPAPAKHLLGR